MPSKDNKLVLMLYIPTLKPFFLIHRTITAGFEVNNLLHAALMPPAFKFGIDPLTDHFLHQRIAHQIRRQAQNIGVVVPPRHLRRPFVMAQRRADPVDLVGGDRHSNPAAAQ